MTENQHDKILLAHGGGGQLTQQLINEHIVSRFKSDALNNLPDSATLNVNNESICFTTDSYVVKPLFFNGGDIGKLAVCGTVNDLAVAGAKPIALSLSLIIETGFEMAALDRILSSIAQAAEQACVQIVTGDTKTVEAGAADQIFINTAGVGVKLPNVNLGFERIRPTDKIIINGTVGDHGMTIISQRKDIRFQTKLKSDCAALNGLTCELLENKNEIKFMRDPTRGGLAATLNEIAEQTGLSVEISQKDIPADPTVLAAAEVLGFDVLNIANEGKFIAVVSAEAADDELEQIKAHPLGKNAAIIGQITEPKNKPLVELITEIGGRRIVQMPYGRELPRIC